MAPTFEDVTALVVEDDPQALSLMSLVLSDLSFGAVLTATTGDEAVRLFTENQARLGLVVADWNLPGPSGLELLKRIRAADHRVPFVMITGRDLVESVVEATTAGANFYLYKPFTPDKLREIVIKALGGKTADPDEEWAKRMLEAMST